MTVTHCFREYFAESLKTALKPKYVCCNILAFIALLTTQSHSWWPHGNLWYPGKKVLPEQLGGGCWRLLVSSRLPQWPHCCGAGCQLEMLNAEPPQLTVGSHSTPAASNFSRCSREDWAASCGCHSIWVSCVASPRQPPIKIRYHPLSQHLCCAVCFCSAVGRMLLLPWLRQYKLNILLI